MFGRATRRRLGWVLLVTLCAYAGLLAFPRPLFAYTHVAGTLTFHSDAPIDVVGAEAVAQDIRAKLDASPFPIGREQFSLYVTNTDWRRRLLFLPAPDAGGFVVVLLTPRHTFLSGGDFPTGRLRAQDGRLLPPPRTLSYYGAHEIAHLLAAWRVGSLRAYVLMPEWVREGIADYAGLGPVRDIAALWRDFGERPLGRKEWDAHGYYIRYRMLVTHFLDHEGWTLDQLLATKLSESEARAAMDARLAMPPRAADARSFAVGAGRRHLPAKRPSRPGAT
jgi:hypothetical protein